MAVSKRLPAEWEPQSAVLITWPDEETDWRDILPEVTQTYLALVREVSSRQRLVIACRNSKALSALLQSNGFSLSNGSAISIFQSPINDTWARDHGPISVISCNSGGPDTPLLLDFCFNGWGMKFAANNDNCITRNLFSLGAFGSRAVYRSCLDFVLEGGSIESDGEGTILTTSQCLLSNNRNEALSRQQIESRLMDEFGASHVLWLNHGYLAGDDTDSHIDTLARLCPGNTIAYVAPPDDHSDEHFYQLSLMQADLRAMRNRQGLPFNLVALPMAKPVFCGAERLPATYANFLVINSAVLMPTYNDAENDSLAASVLSSLFPSRQVVGINCLPLIRQHGSLHCITMQIPAAFGL